VASAFRLPPPARVRIPAAAGRPPPGNVTGCGYNSGKPEERVPPGARSGGRPAGGRRAVPEGGQRAHPAGRERLDE